MRKNYLSFVSFIKRTFFILAVFAFVAGGLFVARIANAANEDYFVTSGSDTTSGGSVTLDNNDLNKLETSNDLRKQSDGAWPAGGNY